MSGFLHVEPIMGLPPHKIQWTLEPSPAVQKHEWPSVRTKTQAEEVWEMVQEMYAAEGKSVPMDEAKACLADIKKEKEEQKRWWALIGTGIPDEEYYASNPPTYGTPEFWKWHAKRKAAAAANK